MMKAAEQSSTIGSLSILADSRLKKQNKAGMSAPRVTEVSLYSPSGIRPVSFSSLRAGMGAARIFPRGQAMVTVGMLWSLVVHVGGLLVDVVGLVIVLVVELLLLAPPRPPLPGPPTPGLPVPTE